MTHDRQLQDAILAELDWDCSVDAGHIAVTADNGTVKLGGRVGSYAEKEAALSAARRVKGVRAIVDSLEVNPVRDGRLTDDAIRAAVMDRLDWDVLIPRNAVHVQVEGGRVTLSGAVEHSYQKAAAEEDVRRLRGVVSVADTIAIRPPVDTGALSDEIVHALHRSWFFDPKTIDVTSDHGRVRLTGYVKSEHERQVAAATAWRGRGVVAVQNDLRVR